MPKLTLKMAVASLLPLYIVAHFVHHVMTAVTAPLLPLIRTSFDLTYAQAGLVLSAYTFAYGAGHLASGWMMSRLGPRLMITAGTAGVATCGLAIGLAPGFALMVALQFLMGIVGSGYHPAATTLISLSVPRESRGHALGLHVIGGSGSNLVTPLLAGLIAAVLGWRGAFLTLAVPTIALGVTIFVLLGRFTPGAAGTRAVGAEQREPEEASWLRIAALVTLSCSGAALAGAAISFLPLLATDTLGVPAGAAAVVVAVANAPGILISPLAGRLSDRLGRVPLLIGVSLAAAAVLPLLARVPHGALFYLLVLLVGAYVFVRMPISESFILGEVAARSRPALLGFYYFGSSALGAAVNPVVGRLADTYGFRASFGWLGAAFALVTLACAAVFRIERGRRPAAASAARDGAASAATQADAASAATRDGAAQRPLR